MPSPNEQSLKKWAKQRCAINPKTTFFEAYVQLCREYNHDITAIMTNRPTIGVFELVECMLQSFDDSEMTMKDPSRFAQRLIKGYYLPHDHFSCCVSRCCHS